MPDGLYERDILAWSEAQADLLRRLSRGERVNDVDWDNVVEEIESVGLSELHSLQSFLRLVILHLLKLNAWPDSDARNHWHGELVGFQDEAAKRLAPLMRQRVDIDKEYASAMRQVRASDPSVRLPGENPFTLDQLLTEDVDTLLSRLSSAPFPGERKSTD